VSLFDLRGRKVAVIGAASGIGAAVARGAAGEGAQVVAFDVDEARLESLAREIEDAGGSAEWGRLDIRDRADVAAALEKIDDLDGVVATPGVNVRKRVLDYTDAELDRVIDVNLKGNFHVLQAAGRILAKRKKGSIVLFSSIRSLVVEPGQSVYAATKAGIVQMVRGLAAELGPSSVRVNAVAPGVVETPLTAPIQEKPEWYRAYAEKSALKRWARAEEMVGPTLFLLSDAASYVTGAVLFVDGGWTAVDGRFDPP
jgi:NAD(P)-dependent dehydrogenase (short-subunit alcohol dehydrogenase family)